MLPDRSVLKNGLAFKYFVNEVGTGRVLMKHISAHDNGSLVIDFVEKLDAGLYTCFVNSSSGNASANTTLVVGGGECFN